MYQLSLRLLKNEEEAVEATQETFRRALKAWDGYRNESKPSTWLFRIAYNVCLARLNKKSKAHESVENFSFPDHPRSRPEAHAQKHESISQVQKALLKLTEEDRRLLCLQMEESLGYEDLAKILACSIETVRMRVCRARQRLKEILMPVIEERRLNA